MSSTGLVWLTPTTKVFTSRTQCNLADESRNSAHFWLLAANVQGLGVLLRFMALFRIRAETVLLLLVQHMLDAWPRYVSASAANAAGGDDVDISVVPYSTLVCSLMCTS
jgi:hypothetical protein